jgi:hypothetical protein
VISAGAKTMVVFELVKFLSLSNLLELCSDHFSTCGLYYKCFTIVIYNRNDSGQYYKTTITIIIDDPS